MDWHHHLVKVVEVGCDRELPRAGVSRDVGDEVAHPDQVVGGSSRGEAPADSSDVTMTSLAQPAPLRASRAAGSVAA